MPPSEAPDQARAAAVEAIYEDLVLLGFGARLPARDSAAFKDIRSAGELLLKAIETHFDGQQPPDDVDRLAAWLHRRSGGKTALIVPDLRAVWTPDEHDIAGREPVAKGEIDCILRVVRPGLRIDGEIVRKADVIVSA